MHSKLGRFFGYSRLREAALGIASAIDPFGTFEIKSSSAEADLTTPHVHVGPKAHLGAFSVAGRGWLTGCGKWVDPSTLIGEELNPLGAILAACIATAWAMRRAIGDTDIYSDALLSLWNLEQETEALDGPALAEGDLGRLLVVGVGAIGSTIAYLLPLLKQNLTAVTLVDHDEVDYPNLNRAPIFLASQVGYKKVDVVKTHLEHNGISATAIPDPFQGGEIPLGEFDFLVPAANVPDAREAIMGDYPPLMISGSTGKEWDAYQQRHIPVKDDCLICRFPSNRAAPILACGEGTIEVWNSDTDEVLEQTGALPFLSCAGAVMAVADIAKLAYEGYPLDGNSTSLSFNGSQLHFMNMQKRPKPGCSFCEKTEILAQFGYRGLYDQLNS